MDGILRKNVLLSGKEIFECNAKLEEYAILNKGMKEDVELGSGDERKSDNTLENLYDLLKIERVFLTNKRSRGIYEKDKNRVKIISAVGKMSNIGYVEDSQTYLRSYEALLLMEMNRLEVTFDTVVMSIEEGYGLFLNSKCELTIEEYVVYSYISRIGYIIMGYDPEYDKEKFNFLEERKKVNKEDAMIFCVLMERLNLPCSRNFIENDYELYLETRKAMDNHAKAISGRNDVTEISCITEPPFKKLRPQIIEDDSNFLDILKTELEYMAYKQIFDKFSYISKKKFNKSESKKPKELNFTFDLFLPKLNFRRTEDLANYRLLVIKSSDEFPSNEELQNLRGKQCYEVPIIIAVVSDNLTAHFSICTF